LIKKFSTGGIEGLRRKVRADKGQSKVSEKSVKFIKGKLLTNPKLSYATIQRQLDRLSGHSNEFSASYYQICRVKDNISEDLLVARIEELLE